MKRVGIVYHPMKEAAGKLAQELEEMLTGGGLSAWRCSAWEAERLKGHVDGTDLIISIGGDGTILRTAQAVAPGTTPITGINLGKIGFMSELDADEVAEKLPALLAGEGWVDERNMLEARLTGSERVFYALNDVVLARGAIARTVLVEASVDDEKVANYRADGVIVATATGSTAYSLAAGGPVLHPQAKNLILLPIMRHLSPPYALVLAPERVVKLHITTFHEATLSVDGHINLPLSNGSAITVKLSRHKARFLRIHPGAFYASLEKKLEGKR